MLRTHLRGALAAPRSPPPWQSGCCRHPARPRRRRDRTRPTIAAATGTATAARSRQRVEDLLGRMTLAEKVGQMAQAERVDVDADPTLITTNGLGSVLSGGGSVPAPNTPEAWADMVDRYQAAALETRLGIPLLYGVDSVHGHGNLLGRHGVPAQHRARRDPRPRACVEKIGHITAEETRATGPQWAFAPCVCVARDDRWGRTYESFGEDPRLVKSMATVIDGLQGKPGQLDRPDRVLATAKHFAGDGLTAYGAPARATTPLDQGIDQVVASRVRTSSRWRRTARRSSGTTSARSCRPSPASTGPTTASATRSRCTPTRSSSPTCSRSSCGFDGLRHLRLAGDPADPGRLPRAGAALGPTPASTCSWSRSRRPTTPNGWDVFIPTLISLVEDGEVPMSRIDDAVSRILTAKFELGLFEKPFTDRPQHRHDRQQGAPQGRPAGRRRDRRCCCRNKQQHAAARAPGTSRSTSPAATPTTSATRPEAGR